MNFFGRATLKMAVGGIVGQLIPVLISPVLTRLYTPESFGVFSSFTAIASILTIPATLRFDLALVRCDDDVEAASLGVLGWIFASIFLSAIAVSVLLLDRLVVPVSSLHPLGIQLALVPLLAWIIATQWIFSAAATRNRSYGLISVGNVVQQFVSAVVAIGLGLAGFGAWGLIQSRFWATAVNVVMLIRIGAHGYIQRGRHALSDARGLLNRHRKFPLFNVPISVSGNLSSYFPILALTSFHITGLAGQFAIARMIVSLPSNFLTSTMSNVFYREGVVRLGTSEFRALVWGLSRSLVLIFIPAYFFLGYWGEAIFEVVFGDKWKGAGNVLMYLALPFALAALTGWPERVFEIRAKQQWSFAIQLGFDLLTMVSIVVVLAAGWDAFLVIKVFAVLQTLYQLAFLAAIYILAGLGWTGFLRIMGLVSVLIAVLAIVSVLLSLNDWLTPFLSATVLAAIACLISLFGTRQFVLLLWREPNAPET